MGLKVVTTLRYLPPGGAERAYEFHGNPGRVHLDPRWHQAALRFVEEGFFHILDGTDHLLFIACLVIPFRRLRPLVVIATAFTVAHSLTLAAAVLGLAPEGLWFPPLVEWLIAVSIVAMALENLVGTSSRRRWIAAFVFGLVHGFGFAFALRESLQFAGSHLATALLSFNVGVELGQLAVLRAAGAGAECAATGRPRAGDGDRPLGPRGAYRLALDERALGDAAPVPLARRGRGHARRRPALADGGPGRGAGGLGGRPLRPPLDGDRRGARPSAAIRRVSAASAAGLPRTGLRPARPGRAAAGSSAR